MAQARQILKRRKTVRNILKITRTMEMVATARFRGLQGRTVQTKPYIQELSDLTRRVACSVGDTYHHPLLSERPDAKRVALLTLASDRGLCGGYNVNVLREALARYTEDTEQRKHVELYTFGKKAASFFRFHKIPVTSAAQQFDPRLELSTVAELADSLMQRFADGNVDRVVVAFTQFISAGVQRPQTITLLPLSQIVPDRASQVRIEDDRLIDFIPDPERMLSQLLPQTVRLRLYQCFLDAMTSEQVARMTAMRLASDNANDMIRELTLRYNRIRQSNITTELSEIITGAEALEG